MGGRQLERAPDMFLVPLRGAMPDAISYNSPASACEKSKQLEGASEPFNAIRRQSTAPDIIPCSALSGAYG